MPVFMKRFLSNHLSTQIRVGALAGHDDDVPAAGGSGSISISTASTCILGGVGNAAFLTVTQGSSGTGNGSISFSVSANSGSQRTAALTVTALKAGTTSRRSGHVLNSTDTVAGMPQAR